MQIGKSILLSLNLIFVIICFNLCFLVFTNILRLWLEIDNVLQRVCPTPCVVYYFIVWLTHLYLILLLISFNSGIQDKHNTVQQPQSQQPRTLVQPHSAVLNLTSAPENRNILLIAKLLCSWLYLLHACPIICMSHFEKINSNIY
jgi:hypothetical protein